MDLSDDRPLQSQPPALQYVAGLMPINLGQYAAGWMASQGHTQDQSFECTALPPFCDRDPVPARYRVLPGVNVCIWCNNGLAMDTLSRKMWCRGHDGNGHEVWRSDMDLENNSFCNACEETIGM
jgi:hypothetical protein